MKNYCPQIYYYDHVRIEKVYASCENYDRDSGLGHRTVLISLGKTPHVPSRKTIFQMKRFKNQAKAWKKLQKIDATALKQPDLLAKTADWITEETKRLMERSMITVSARRHTPQSRALEGLENAGSDIMKDQKTAKKFFQFAGEFK